MKRIICIFVLSFTIIATSLPAYPFIFAALRTGWSLIPNNVKASLLLHAVGAAAGYYAYMTAGGRSSVDSYSGTINRPSEVEWVDLTMVPPSVESHMTTTRMEMAQAQDLANKHPDQYPLLKAALFKGAPDAHLSNVTGDIVQDPELGTGNSGRVTGTMGGSSCASPSGYTHTSSSPSSERRFYSQVTPPIHFIEVYENWHSCGGTTYGFDYKRFTVDIVPSPTPVPKTPSEAVPVLTNNATGTTVPVSAEYQAELDKMMQDPEYVPTFSDATTGLPFYPPPASHIASPEAVDAYNQKGQAAADAAAAAAAARGTAATTAGDAATQARNAATYWRGLANASPGDATLEGKAKDAEAHAREAEAAADKAASDAAAGDAEDSDYATNVPTADAPATLNFDKFNALMGTAKQLGPYQLLTSVEDYMGQLLATPVAPVISVPVAGQTMTINLAILDPFASLVRWCMALFITIGSIMMVIKFWRGVS